MVYHCAALYCTASTRKVNRHEDYPWMRGVTFHKFPSDKLKQSRWIRLCKRGGKDKNSEDRFKVIRNSRLCSRHFEHLDSDGKPVGDPTLWHWNNYGMYVTARPALLLLGKWGQMRSQSGHRVISCLHTAGAFVDFSPSYWRAIASHGKRIGR